MERKARLINLLEQAVNEEVHLLEHLPEAKREAYGTELEWAAKDMVAHLVGWNEVLVYNLVTGQQPAEAGEADDDDTVNARLFRKYQPLDWQTVCVQARKVMRDLAEQLSALSEADLESGQLFAWQHGHPLWKRVVGVVFDHPMTHLAMYYGQNGQPEQALALRESAAQHLLALDESAEWCSVVWYNLACVCALTGNLEKTTRHLAEAFRLKPDLVEWSRKDPDFDRVRSAPEFQALYPA